ncbi:MAG: hypothetical protein Q8S18_01680 [Bacteroidales bacterium]|nr:hypothetical protein [Bacteroidales bacterium]
MRTIQFKEKLEVVRHVRFSKSQMNEIYVYCRNHRIQFSDLVRNAVERAIKIDLKAQNDL